MGKPVREDFLGDVVFMGGSDVVARSPKGGAVVGGWRGAVSSCASTWVCCAG